MVEPSIWAIAPSLCYRSRFTILSISCPSSQTLSALLTVAHLIRRRDMSGGAFAPRLTGLSSGSPQRGRDPARTEPSIAPGTAVRRQSSTPSAGNTPIGNSTTFSRQAAQTEADPSAERILRIPGWLERRSAFAYNRSPSASQDAGTQPTSSKFVFRYGAVAKMGIPMDDRLLLKEGGIFYLPKGLESLAESLLAGARARSSSPEGRGQSASTGSHLDGARSRNRSRRRMAASPAMNLRVYLRLEVTGSQYERVGRPVGLDRSPLCLIAPA